MKQRNKEFTATLLKLQNVVKRDPSLYYEEFCGHHEYFKAKWELLKMKPDICDTEIMNLVMFLAHVSTHYKEDLKEYPHKIMDFVKQHYYLMDPEMRMCFCKALILMRNRGFIEALDVMPLFFRLFRAKDKVLRKYLQTHIITDIKNMNSKHKNMKLNSTLQNLMYKVLTEDYAVASKMSLDIMIELYKKNIWKDEKTVNAIALACFSKVNKVLVAAHQFFLGADEDDEEKDSSDSENDDTPTVKDVMNANKVNKKSRSRMKILKRTKKAVKKSKKKKDKVVFDFSAIHLLHDPQGMAEKLLKKLTEMHERYEIKMMVMSLISRLVGVHELILLNFYVLLLRYLQPHQREVTKILTFAAQAAHEFVPPDAIEPVVKTIANNFVNERNSFEAMTVGINAIREICARCPLAISHDLLQDIVEYRSFKNKNVMMAARALIQLFRKISPQILKRKFRNKPTESSRELDSLEYGALKAKSYIPGSEALSIEAPAQDVSEKDNGEEKDNDSDGSWINVSHSDDEVEDENADWETDEDEEEEEEENGAEKEDCVSGEINKVINKKDDNKNGKKDKNSINKIDKEKATTISQNRIFSQEEFKKLKAVQIAKEVKFAKGKKRKVGEEEEVNVTKEIVTLRDIEKLHKKPRANKESRLSTVLEGREGREKFGKKHEKNPFASKTNKAHKKNKAFMMIKHKLRSKQKRSFKDKQISLRNALLKRRRNR